MTMRKNTDTIQRRQEDVKKYVKEMKEQGLTTDQAVKQFADDHYLSERTVYNDYTAPEPGRNRY